jgi:hypothetical protein
MKGKGKMITLIYDAPPAVTESSYGVAIGYYTDCDSAVCRDCAPRGFEAGDYSEWPGFEGWEEPSAIFNDTESDTPTHCVKCQAVIRHDLTVDGTTYVTDAIAEFISDGSSHDADCMAQWWDAYSDTLDAADLREIIERAMVAAGCRTLRHAEARAALEAEARQSAADRLAEAAAKPWDEL